MITRVNSLIPMCYTSGVSRSVIFEKQNFNSGDHSGDVIHRTFQIFSSYLYRARNILPKPKISLARDVIIGGNWHLIFFPRMTLLDILTFQIFPRFTDKG